MSEQLSDAELAELAERFRRASSGPVRILTRLPLRVRAALALQRFIDRVAIWHVEHGWLGAAERLWRNTGGW